MSATAFTRSQASEDFNRARTLAFLSKIQHFLRPDKDKLLSFTDVKTLLRPKNEVYKGLQIVPIDMIVGSEGRYQDFNKYFLPKSDFLRKRWEHVDEAVIESIVLPPIQLYEIGGVYFVRDGNHRVSVAKAQGMERIDAEVTSLSSEVTIRPGMTTSDLKRLVVRMEKEAFYEKTHFAELTGCETLDFSNPGRYDVIYQHILVHKYYLNESKTGEIPFSEALVSWYNNVYLPIIDIIRAEGITERFPKRTESDLYVYIVKRWDSLKQQYGVEVSAEQAVHEFADQYGEKPQGFLKTLLSGEGEAQRLPE